MHVPNLSKKERWVIEEKGEKKARRGLTEMRREQEIREKVEDE